jgi:hypothetical protein
MSQEDVARFGLLRLEHAFRRGIGDERVTVVL